MFPLLFVLHPVPAHGVWRWAIYHVSEKEMLANPRAGCVNAGLQPTREAADDIGQQCLYTLLHFAALLKHSAPVTALTYDADLVPDVPGAPLMAHLLQMGD